MRCVFDVVERGFAWQVLSVAASGMRSTVWWLLFVFGFLAAFSLSSGEAVPVIDKSLLIECSLTCYIETPFVERVAAAVTTKEYAGEGVKIPAGAEVVGVAIPGDRIVLGKDEWTIKWKDPSGMGLKYVKIKAQAVTNIVERKNPPATPRFGIGGYAVEPGPVDDILATFGLADDPKGGPVRVRASEGTVFALQLSKPIRAGEVAAEKKVLEK